MARTALVVGASIGGIRTAQALRSEGWEDRIVVLGAEPDQPYDKPPLSKQVLAGSWDPARALLLDESDEDLELELRLGTRAASLDAAEHEVVLADGGREPYDVLLVATGAAARPSPWRPSSGVHVLRTMTDALALRTALEAGGDVVVIGGGFVGAEVASTATGLGCSVTLVDPMKVPMGRVLGDEVGRLFIGLHERHGVRTRFGIGVERVTGRAGDLEVELTDGTLLAAGTVVVGIGARPEDGWLADSGLLVEDGIVCDASGRAQGARDVFAVGDVSRWYHPRRGAHVRIEHWTNAVEQAGVAAATVVHPERGATHVPVEYVWSDQHDWRSQVVGVPSTGTSHVVLGDPAADGARFGVVYSDGPRFAGAAFVNWPRGMALSRRLLAAGEPAEVALERLRAALP